MMSRVKTKSALVWPEAICASYWPISRAPCEIKRVGELSILGARLPVGPSGAPATFSEIGGADGICRTLVAAKRRLSRAASCSYAMRCFSGSADAGPGVAG